MYERLCKQFPKDMLKLDHFVEESQVKDFPVLVDGEKTVSSINLSELLGMPLVAAISRIYADRSICEEVRRWANSEANNSDEC